MFRSLSRAPLRSVAESFSRDKGRNNVFHRTAFSRTFFDSEGSIHPGLGADSITGSLQTQIVSALHSGERGRASNLLSNLSHENIPLRAQDFVYILDYCARSPDPLFVMETLRIMEEKEIGMNNRCYMFILQSLSRGGYFVQAFNWLTFHGENNKADLSLYNAFLNACARLQSMDHVKSCLDLMESRLIGKSEITYCELLKFAVWQNNLSAVHEIWKEFTKYYSPSLISLRKFIWSFTRLSDLSSAYEALQHMVALAVQGDASTKRSSEGKFRSSRLDIPIPSNSGFRMKGLNMGEDSHSLPSISFLDGLISEGEYGLSDNHGDVFSEKDQASFDLEEHSNRKFVEAEKGCTGLSQFPASTQGINFSLLRKEIVNGLMKKKELKTVGFSMVNKHIQSEPVKKVIRWSFSDVIHSCAQSRNYELAKRLFLQMHELGLDPSSHTYDGLIRAVVSEKGVNEGLEMLNIMEEMNMKPYNATLATLSIGCSKMLELDIAEALLDRLVECPSLQPFNAFLAACDIKDQPERAVRVLAKMKKLKLNPDIRTYELLFSLFANVNAPYEKGNMLSQVDVRKRINAIEMDMVKNGVQQSHTSMENLLKALGAEGMIRELIQYLHMAQSQIFVKNTYSGTTVYNVVLHSLVDAKETHMAVQVFKDMKKHELPTDAATYNIMIDCCSTLRCYKSASVLLSLMLRDGFFPQACTYTALIKILLAYENFEEALRLLDQVRVEGVQPDVLLFNTILLEAYLKGRIDIIELIVELMHQEKIRPDPSTCCYVFSAYVDRGFDNTAMEALQVLSMRMISEDEGFLQENRKYFEEDFILAEDLEVESRITNVFKDSEENLATALFNLRWCAFAGFSISWLPDESQWARRLSSSYGSRAS